MEQLPVKTEHGEIVFLYLDENADNDPNNIQNMSPEEEIIEQQEETYIYEDEEDDEDDIDTSQLNEEDYKGENWSGEETQRLLVFFVDNKATFLTGAAKKKRLWGIACQTMITGKKPESCAMKLEFMKKEYVKWYLQARKGMKVTWPHYKLCHIAFEDDKDVKLLISQREQEQIKKVKVEPAKKDGIITVKQVSLSPADEKVEAMLKSYLKHKKKFRGEHFQKWIWKTIAVEIGDTGECDYWHRRFLNFKQHYARLCEKRESEGSDTIHWPYMDLFDQIFGDDPDFKRKYLPKAQEKELTIVINQNVTSNTDVEDEWNDTEVTVLAKYFFDCFEDFQDPSIPKDFLWSEVGKLLDRQADACKEMYEHLKESYFEQRLKEDCEMRYRSALVILFDHIVSKEMELALLAINPNPNKAGVWKTRDTDVLVQFFADHIEMFKDPICHYVCWALVVQKINKDLISCRNQWEELTSVYQSILSDKKEYPDMQIDWRYMELFDQIFDYGTDEILLIGYDKQKKKSMQTEKKSEDETTMPEEGEETKLPRGVGDAKVFKILEYYLKNKEKFIRPDKKQKLWEVLSKDIGMPALEIDHRFRNLKQVYTNYIQREIKKPEMPIMWPYFSLCKKVFGYRAIKTKLKSSKDENDEEWAAREIKQLISFVTTNINVHSDKISESDFSELAGQIDKTEKSCYEKYTELLKSYRKLKTMKKRNSDVKATWKYYNAFDQAFKKKQVMETEEMGNELETIEDEHMESIWTKYGSANEGGTDDDYTIIVVPEGQDVSQALSEAQIKTENSSSKWHLRSKRSLLKHYINYVKTHKGLIDPQEMWQHISSQFPDKQNCRKMFIKLKSTYIGMNKQKRKENLYHDLLEKVIKLKPKLVRNIIEDSECQDVELARDKIEKALKYYLEHYQEFLSARYEKKYLWAELAQVIQEPVTKVFNKISYLKKDYVKKDRQPTEFDDILKIIITKENEFTFFGETLPELNDVYEEHPWTDSAVEQLLSWYLLNLNKFKSPKFVRNYLWIEAANNLARDPLSCSNKIMEIRAQYKNMVKNQPEQLTKWKFLGLCQKIYGTGKKEESDVVQINSLPDLV